ncbi:ATP-binding response regulator [Bacteroides caecigallinarum]|uniref:ATP-binding response regulator n=1 Tax=Bacteroides caecigallinarum TaxID=1411144 RepID=UPI001F43129A|nr:ATP-binding protein [Bacteroides caecigallinarum]MCF2580441.1 response regulator [Bacteroides caecigallinarum]
MFSTKTKLAFGYIILIILLLGAIGYVYKQMTLLTQPTGLEESIYNRRRTTHSIISRLYETEVIGQALRTGSSDEIWLYTKAMKKVHLSLDTLRSQLTDTIQQARIDTVNMLLRDKERNMLAVLEALSTTPTDIIYRKQLDSLLHEHDSLINESHVRRRVVTHHNTYTIHHEPKGFFRRLADVFAPGKADSTEVSNVVEEVFTDTIDQVFSPIDTIASMLSGIQDKVFQTRQDELRTLSYRINRLKIAGSHLSQRVNQLLESIEEDEQAALAARMYHEQSIRRDAAIAMAAISVVAIILVLVFFTIIWRDLTRSNHYRNELEKARDYAEDLLRAREKLMLTITHDIKAPAGSIIGYTDLLERLINDKRQKFYLDSMKNSAQHLLALVTSLLDYHRLEAGKMDLNPVAFRPFRLMEDIYNSFLPLAEKKNINLNYSPELEQNLTLEGDPFRIRQIVENLLSNALKFTNEGCITLTVSYSGVRLRFSVEDTGCGMSKAEQEKIFTEFTRLPGAQGQEGFGLGLSITRKLVELQNGQISVESTPGHGSCFSVIIPLPSYTHEKDTEEPETENPNPTISNIRILIIDDDSIQLQLTKDMLLSLTSSEKNVIRTIVCCQHPEEVFERINEEEFDIIFTDIQMPAMDGFHLLEAIRNIPCKQAQDIPVVAITARAIPDDEGFRARGFAAVLRKPFSRKDIINAIGFALNKTSTDITEFNADKNDIVITTCNENKTISEESSVTSSEFNFSRLTEFSMDDVEAARCILTTFADETRKNITKMDDAISRNDIKEICAIAHKMLPTFIMIEAREAIPSLQWLDEHKEKSTDSETALTHAHIIIKTAINAIRVIDDNAS